MSLQLQMKAVGTQELWEQFQAQPLDIYRDVAKEMSSAGIEETPTMSRALEYISPSQDNDTLDAFGRLLREAGIITRSNSEAGYWASPGEAFLATPGTRALFTEFFARQWRKVSFGAGSQRRAIVLSGDAVPGSWERPYVDAMTPRWDQRIAPAIPLSELVAMTTPISSDAYRSFYLNYDAEELRKFRVGESAEIPIATIKATEQTIRLKKYGRGLRASYEELRRMRVVNSRTIVQQ